MENVDMKIISFAMYAFLVIYTVMRHTFHFIIKKKIEAEISIKLCAALVGVKQRDDADGRE